MTFEDCRRRADALLTEATQTANLKRRSELLGEAAHWHKMALDARERRDGSANDNTQDKMRLG